MTDKKLSRRRLLALGLSAAATIPVAALIRARPALAGDTPKLDETDPMAQTLGYKHDAAAVDREKFPKMADGNNCANCSLYGGGDWGPCTIFPGKLVKAEGWCNAWVPKG